MARQINAKGLALIKKWEGCKLEAYLCPSNVLTIGYGHTGTDVKPGMKITQAQASQLLLSDLVRFTRVVDRAVKVNINDNQFSALVSLAFNIGPDNFLSSTLLRMLNENKHQDAARQFRRWARSRGKVLAGLVARRLDEEELFLTP